MDCAGPSGPSPEQEAPGDAMWLLGNDSPCSASAGRGLITIKSRFMALLSHPVDELAALESEGFPWSGIVCPCRSSRFLSYKCELQLWVSWTARAGNGEARIGEIPVGRGESELRSGLVAWEMHGKGKVWLGALG